MKFSSNLAFKFYSIAISIEHISKNSSNADNKELKEYAFIQKKLEQSSDGMIEAIDDFYQKMKVIQKEKEDE